MRRVLLVSGVAALVLVALAAMPVAAKSPRGFAGKWEGIDLKDGSTLMWRVKTERGSEGNAFHIRGSDDSCSDCGGEPAGIRGIGLQHTPNELKLAFSIWGLGTSDHLRGPQLATWTYDPVTDTITAGSGNVYHRVGHKD